MPLFMLSRDEEIRSGMVFENRMLNPTAMYRRTVLRDESPGYNETFQMAADDDVWTTRLSHVLYYNVNQAFTPYRRRPSQATATAARSRTSLHEHPRI